MDSSSSNSSNQFIGRRPCVCGSQIRIYTSWTKDNPGRRFLRCSGTIARRNDVPELCDGWKFNENWFFNTCILKEAKESNLNDVNVLNEACQRTASRMSAFFGRRFSLSSIKTKLEHMRTIHRMFGKYISTPGVTYDIENCDTTVTVEYWRAVNPGKENALFRHFRLNGNPFHIMHETIFEIEGVAEFPKDLTGSPGWPIHIRDSDDDEKAVVLVGDGTKLKFPELDDPDNQLIKPGKFNGSTSAGSGDGEGDGMFGDSLWNVD
ncbi:hypothetical protein ACJIZ3_009053 [Penstemon smallii]|uniref:Zinc finger GRF-type domain-containing protein n=1 Tax=Penstemon smallii TaxID=265156 RepID=A0ABD3TBG2_9LAMI